MKPRHTDKLIRGLVLALGLAATSAGADIEKEEAWRFHVLLDDAPIGYHEFRVTHRDGEIELRTQARFEVKFLFFTAYRYTHDNTEIWNEDCLRRIDATTDDNGDRKRVRGVVAGDRMLLTTPQGAADLGGCVLSFAYWNPRILTANNLLNSQTGEYVAVAVQDLGTDAIEARGRMTAARKYRIVADDLAIDLWYSPQAEWLALESTTDNGRRLRYRLTQ